MEEKSFDLISVGDATIDHFVLFHDATTNCRLDKNTCQLCINYADKLPVDQYIRLVAGNAANNAVGSSRLGLKTAYYTVLGNDDSGRQIKSKLEEEGVDSKFVILEDKEETNNSFVLSFMGERTIMVYHSKHKYQLPTLPFSQWLYLTSTGPGFEQMFKSVAAHVKSNGVKMGFNPGTYQLRGDTEVMSECLAASEVVFINVEEAQSILKESSRDIKTLLSGMHDLGSGIVVITDAENGAYAYDGKEFWHINQFSDQKVETTGAGDSFATGFIGALHYDLPISEALRWGGVNSKSVVMHIGPQEGLLTKALMEQRLAGRPDYVAKKL